MRKMSFKAIIFVYVIFNLYNAIAMPTSSVAETQNPSVMCKLPEARGHCRALLPRWRYDPSTGKCHEFKFGGCDGNGNNFMSQKTCMTVCRGI